MKRAKVFLVAAELMALVAGTASFQSEAMASHYRRETCFTRNSAGARGRQMGVRNANRLFQAVWSRLGRSCDQIDRLVNIIADTPLQAPLGNSSEASFQGCFYQGYVETLFAGLEDASIRCENKCFQAGSEIGEISAQGYCAASMALGGLDDPGFIAQPALPLCGFNVVMGCKSEYVYTATYAFAGCRTFTEGYFSETFDNTVRQDCFVPTDIPIRD